MPRTIHVQAPPIAVLRAIEQMVDDEEYVRPFGSYPDINPLGTYRWIGKPKRYVKVTGKLPVTGKPGHGVWILHKRKRAFDPDTIGLKIKAEPAEGGCDLTLNLTSPRELACFPVCGLAVFCMTIISIGEFCSSRPPFGMLFLSLALLVAAIPFAIWAYKYFSYAAKDLVDIEDYIEATTKRVFAPRLRKVRTVQD